MRTSLSFVLAVIVAIGGFLIWRTTNIGRHPHPMPTNEIVVEARQAAEAPLHIDDFIQNVDSYD